MTWQTFSYYNTRGVTVDPKTVSCHFIGYPKKSKGFCFYCLDIYTKFVEMSHAIFLEDEMMRGSMVAQEIDLEEKRVCVPTPMIQEPFFELPVLVAPIVRDTIVPTPVVSSPMVTVNDDEEPVPQDPIETDATDEGKQQHPQTEDVPNVEAPRRSQRIRTSTIPNDYEMYNTEEFQMEGDPTLFEEVMRSDNSSKWLKAVEDEIKSMSTNKVWDLEPIPKGAKTVGCKWI
jgi:hypothetical protein